MSALVDQLYARAFGSDNPRDPRSQPYMDGVKAALAYRLDCAPFKPPYRMGTVEADAWFAGWDEGANRARAHHEQTLLAGS